MRNRFDQLAKELGLETLRPLGPTDAQYALNAETLFADLRHEPDPGHDEERRRLGLLGLLAHTPCLIEVYSQSPGTDDVRSCLAKHLAYTHERERRGRTDTAHEGQLWTWIISAGVPRSALAALTFQRVPDRPGLYVLAGNIARLGVNLGLVVASELPHDRTTLLIRIMAGGTQLAKAVRELATLPRDAYERLVAEPVVLRFRHALEQDMSEAVAPEEQEQIMVMYKSFEELQEAGRAEGRAEGRADTLRRLLAIKFGPLSAEHAQRISAAGPDEIDRVLERILSADTIEAVFAT